jgi:hypothetical protein
MKKAILKLHNSCIMYSGDSNNIPQGFLIILHDEKKTQFEIEDLNKELISFASTYNFELKLMFLNIGEIEQFDPAYAI